MRLLILLCLISLPALGFQGGGALSVGGRGGAVIEVTNLNDAGIGSLRACVMAVGARTCVFRVGGIINLKSMLYITNSYLTVAGQTAPGGGILLSTKGTTANALFGIAAHDVIWQYTRLRNGYTAACSNAAKSECGGTGIVYSGGYNVILDHNSTTWNQDEGFGIWDATAYKARVKNVTLSYNMIAEGLASHSTGIITGGDAPLAAQMTDIDMHHNLIMNNSHRNPLFKHKSGRIINNIFYNQSFYINQVGGGIKADIIGNLFKPGPMNRLTTHEIQGFTAADTDASPGSPSMYVSGNQGWHQANPNGDQWLMTAKVSGENGAETGAIPSTWKRTAALPVIKVSITTEQVASIETSILPTVGASRQLNCDGTWAMNRDSVDARLIKQYQTNTGIKTLPVNEIAAGGFPVIANGTACVDTDHDGMPDIWEKAKGLNPTNAADRNSLAANGALNLQNYLGWGQVITILFIILFCRTDWECIIYEIDGRMIHPIKIYCAKGDVAGIIGEDPRFKNKNLFDLTAYIIFSQRLTILAT